MLRILTALVLSATFASVGLAGDHKKKMAKGDKDAKKAAATAPATKGDTKTEEVHGDAHGEKPATDEHKE